MSIVAEFTVPSDEFPLGRFFDPVPGASVKLDRLVPVRDSPVPYVWVRGATDAAVEAAVRDDQDVESLTVVDRLGDTVLYRVEWSSYAGGVFDCLLATDVSLLSASGEGQEWVFEVRGDTTAAVSTFHDCCGRNGVALTLQHIHELVEVRDGGRYDLTPQQEEALLLAFEEGYYEEPSETDLAAMAEQLGISRPSMSARLKRGYRNLIRRTIVQGTD